MSIRTKLFYRGKLLEEQMVRFLIRLDDRVTDLEQDGSSAYDDTALKNRVTELENKVKALEDAQ